jgi:hypothetical protein
VNVEGLETRRKGCHSVVFRSDLGHYHCPVDWKRVIVWVFVIFVVYMVFAAPNQAAVMVRDTGEVAYDIVRNGAESLREFANTLISS